MLLESFITEGLQSLLRPGSMNCSHDVTLLRLEENVVATISDSNHKLSAFGASGVVIDLDLRVWEKIDTRCIHRRLDGGIPAAIALLFVQDSGSLW